MKEDTTLRDEFARERTLMSNERTFLAYVNTSLALLGLAVVISKFASRDVALIAAPLSVTLALFAFFWGFRSYRAMALRIANEKQQKASFLSLAKAE